MLSNEAESRKFTESLMFLRGGWGVGAEREVFLSSHVWSQHSGCGWYWRVRKLGAGLKSLKGLIASVWGRREGCSQRVNGLCVWEGRAAAAAKVGRVRPLSVSVNHCKRLPTVLHTWVCHLYADGMFVKVVCCGTALFFLLPTDLLMTCSLSLFPWLMATRMKFFLIICKGTPYIWITRWGL